MHVLPFGFKPFLFFKNTAPLCLFNSWLSSKDSIFGKSTTLTSHSSNTFKMKWNENVSQSQTRQDHHLVSLTLADDWEQIPTACLQYFTERQNGILCLNLSHYSTCYHLSLCVIYFLDLMTLNLDCCSLQGIGSELFLT